MIFRIIRDHLVPEFSVRDCCRVLRVTPAATTAGFGIPAARARRGGWR
jgi:hypothetical protein